MMKAATLVFPAVCLALAAGQPEAVPPRIRPTPAFAATKPQVERALRKAAKPFDRARPDFSPLDGLFRRARVFGLGQATHGTREIFQAQADLFAYLVEKHGVRSLLWEDSWGQVAPINDYLQGRQPDLGPLAMNLMKPWRTQEVGNLFRWMRKWNMDHPADPVDLLGIDIQACNERTFEDLCALLPQEESPRWMEIVARAKAAAMPASGAPPLSLEDQLKAQTGMEELLRRVELLACGQKDKHWLPAFLAGRSVLGALKLNFGMACQERGRVGKTIAASAKGALVDLIRDTGMAANVLALMENLPAKKFALFAHSLHVAKDTNVEAYLSLGSLLGFSFNNPDYPEDRQPAGTLCTVAFGTRRGTVLAKSASELLASIRNGTPSSYQAHPIPALFPNSLEAMLGKVGAGKDLLVDLHRTEGWLDLPLFMFVTGASMATAQEPDPAVDASYNYFYGPPARMFDAFVLLDQTHATTLLERF